MNALKIRKNDIVIAVSGAHTGKTGKVLEVLPKRGCVLVEGVHMVKKTLRKSQDAPKGGIVEKEGPIAASNLMLYCAECKRGAKTSRLRDGDRRVRKCRRCGHQFEN
jgi:large subunit ribosomal protein L24